MKVSPFLIAGTLCWPLLADMPVSAQSTHRAPHAPQLTTTLVADEAEAEQLVQQGRDAYNQEDFSTAIEYYTQAIGLIPDQSLVYFLRGNSYLALEAFESALADQTQAIELDPDFARAYGARGFAHHGLGDIQAAVDDFWQAASLFREQGNAEGYFHALRAIRLIAP